MINKKKITKIHQMNYKMIIKKNKNKMKTNNRVIKTKRKKITY